MLSERARKLILASVLGNDPRVRAKAEIAAQGEQFAYQARILKLDPATIDRMAAIADRAGPMTLLPNVAVWRAVWQSMLERAAKGLPPIPDDDLPVAWADHVWMIMYGMPVQFEQIPHIADLALALLSARSSEP